MDLNLMTLRETLRRCKRRLLVGGCFLCLLHSCAPVDRDGITCVTEMLGKRHVLFELCWHDIDSIDNEGHFYINEDKFDIVFTASGTLSEFFEIHCKGNFVGRVNIANNYSSNGNSNFIGEPFVEFSKNQWSLMNTEHALHLVPHSQDSDSSRWREILIQARSHLKNS